MCTFSYLLLQASLTVDTPSMEIIGQRSPKKRTTVGPRYNEDLRTMKITLLYLSKKTKEI